MTPRQPSAAAAPPAAGLTREAIAADYRIGVRSRQASLLGRREVLTGKAKFGIFGDGKEVAQVAMAHAFRPGDVRSGYYRDQTLALALGMATLDEFFAQLYGDADATRDPHSAGRSMSAHFGTRMLDAAGHFRDLTAAPHTASDISPTGSQMPRLVGLAQASKLYREIPGLAAAAPGFSKNGDEIAWGTIGNASCAEGMFWEAVNAAGVLSVPMLLSVWDDGYGISVPNRFQVTKSNVGELLSGFRRAPGTREGYDLYTVRGWDYPALVETYARAAETMRREHVPAVVHVVEMTQPQGHSTSGSHERYKSKERLAWEEEFDPLKKMRQWMLAEGLASASELDALEAEETRVVRESQRRSWDAMREPIQADCAEGLALVEDLAAESKNGEIERVAAALKKLPTPLRRDVMAAAGESLVRAGDGDSGARTRLAAWRDAKLRENAERFGSHLWSTTPGEGLLEIAAVPARYADDAPTVNGFEVVNACFDAALARDPRFLAFGEDLGQLGDVNQGFAGLQAKYGPLRVADVGIRETTIIGQAIGLAMRGLRPLAEVQYLDYILYCLQILSDDLATLRWRTAGGQKAPAIIRTRGHRLEGIWHAGSPMAGVLNLVRGIAVAVPRNMTQAAGFYNALLASDEPGIVVEVLNGYRAKERMPANIGEFVVPFGVPEVLREGRDITVVTYGPLCKIALEAADLLAAAGVDVELIDVQTLAPFDRHHRIVESARKTNRLLCLDEDVPGGASAFMLQQIVDVQGAFHWLDTPARALSAKEHRPAYGSDGDYFSKPNRESIVEAVLQLVRA
jgi:pyruvate/2-oxoglutarate/acetoin dehydrogenase E1 component/TPP-dependent pyruvate/acetoin dehydrogenase alpha subunit